MDLKVYHFLTQEDNNIGMIGYGFEKNRELGCMHWKHYIVPMLNAKDILCAQWQCEEPPHTQWKRS